jgi:hypothetical protein
MTTVEMMAVGIVDNALDIAEDDIREQERIAAESKARREANKNKKPIFLWLQAGYTANVRPVHDLKIMLYKHAKWNSDPTLSVNALCVRPFGMVCEICKRAEVEDDKKLKAQKYFYLPVFVHGVTEKKGKDEVPVTFEQTQEDGSKITKNVQGFRVIEMTSSGVIKSTLNDFMGYAVDTDYKGLTGSNFLWSQTGKGQDKEYSLRAKPPVEMDPKLKAATPPLEDFLQAIIDRLTPQTDQIAGNTSIPTTPAPAPVQAPNVAALKLQAQEAIAAPVEDEPEYNF